ncbi:fibronectin type III domain-containing protein, partial [Streptomyces sp. JHA26]|uniref:fibronectin type III domain-containing protein n=1 Tax=Streptomyces sp. JHA26 TaxID=1917143 RepID=UPI00098A7078
MRGVPVPAPHRVPLRRALLCGVLVLVSSCGWGTGHDDGGAPPGAPTGVTAAAGSATSVHVMWNAVDGAETYEVYRGATRVREVPAADRMVDVTRLRPSTAYTFTVRARDADGRLGPSSAEVRATTPGAAAADRSAPTRPPGAHGRATGSRTVRLAWSTATDDRGVVSYDVYQGDTKIHSVGGTQVAAVLTGLRPGTRYVFTVRARDAADNLSPASAAVRLTTPGADDGRAPRPVALRREDHGVDRDAPADLQRRTLVRAAAVLHGRDRPGRPAQPEP